MMQQMPTDPSAVFSLLLLIYREANRATGHSWSRLNNGMRNALKLAISSGFEFSENDIVNALSDRFQAHLWVGDSKEWIYSLAVCDGNKSAAMSYEFYAGRKPFIAENVTPCDNGGERSKERLHVGAGMFWNGERVKVTSFSQDGQAVIACSYSSPRKVKRRFIITRDDLVVARGERKERDYLRDRLSAVSKADASGKTAKKIKRLLQAKTRPEFDALPIEKIRKVLERLTEDAT